MQVILKVVSILIGLFVILNGILVTQTPPFGDEPQGYAIIVIGLCIPLLTLWIGRVEDRSEA